MRNIFKKSLFIVLGCLIACGLHAQTSTTKTYTFDDNVPFATDWTLTKNVPSGGNGDCTIATPSKFTAKNGNYMYFVFENKSNITLTVTSTASYSNISNITFDAVANDNSKPTFTLNIVDDNGTIVQNIYSNKTTKTDFNTGGTNKWGVSNSTISPAVSGHIQLVLNASSSGKYAAIDNLVVTYSGGGGGGGGDVAVTGVSLNKTSTSIQVGASEQLTATVEPSNATNKAVNWSSNPTSVATVDNSGNVTAVAEGTATITVTTQDGNKTATCTVTVTPASSDPVAVTGVSLNKTSTTLTVGGSETLTATVQPSNATNKAINWSSNPTSVATVDNSGNVTAVTEGTATITVTTQDGNKTATCTVTVNAAPPTPPTPPTTLTLHLPEVYEAPTTAGGYNTPLVVSGGREYEVYYINRDGNSKLSVATSNTDKLGAITTPDGSNGCYATDGWFTLQSAGSGGDDSFAQKDEFGQSTRKVNMKEGNEILLHVKGFDQFSLVGKDNNNTGTKCLKVYINNVEQTMTYNKDNYTIRRFGLNGESLIRITAISTSNSTVVAFSLRVAQQPRTKYLDGNDSTQVVYQTQEPDPVYYYTKYSRIAGAQTQLEWVGAQATGITLLPGGQDALGDTLLLGGTAYCQCGTYSYNVVSYFNNVETNRVSGKLNVATYIRSTSRDTVFEAFTNEPMDEITYQYLALSADSVHLVWKTTAPAGISGQGSTTGTKYIISGTPIAAGTYDYTVKIGGGNSLNGRIVVKSIDTGTDPILYLYKNSLAYENDGVYQYLTSSAGGSNNLIPRKASENGPRTDYNKYKWILISEDVDADNAEVMAIVRDNAAKLPVLNMKGFTYAKGRLNWGEPNNGTIDSTTNNGCYIYVQQSTHPIFNGFTLNQNGALQVLNKVNKKGVMPIDINNCAGTLCLATAYTRNIDDYDKDGELQTIIHEVPVGVNGKTKHYICFPLANTKDNMTDNGKKLLKNIVSYLKGTSHFTNMPELEITSFSVAGFTAKINQAENLIELELTKEQFEQADSLKAVKPEIAVKDSKTHVVPGADEEFDLRYATFMPASFVVTDYINRRAYSFKISLKKPEGLEDIYEAGEWVNIFDIYGRKIATTNEDIYTMELPRGMYIIVTEKGQSIKLMK